MTSAVATTALATTDLATAAVATTAEVTSALAATAVATADATTVVPATACGTVTSFVVPSFRQRPVRPRLTIQNNLQQTIVSYRIAANGQLPVERERVTVEQALNHPTWDMGRKITIDSSTLFNKGLEMIEARGLFGIEMDRIDVIVHPQSIVHSMVEFVDGSVLAQLSHTDMCFPIQYAVTWPERLRGDLKPLDFAELAQLNFEAPRYDDFPALNLARRAGTVGGTLPAVYNAANEVAVDAFCDGKIAYPQIWKTVEQVMDAHEVQSASELSTLIEADRSARLAAESIVSPQ